MSVFRECAYHRITEAIGMGKGLGYEIVEILLVCHGSDHNDTICLAERKL